MSEIVENGKTFIQRGDGTLVRQHDDNFTGMRFEHKRCPFCGRITSLHSLHWLNHLDKCAPIEFSSRDLLELKHKDKSRLSGLRIGRNKPSKPNQ